MACAEVFATFSLFQKSKSDGWREDREGKCDAVRWRMQRAAQGIGVRCTGRCSVLRYLPQESALSVPPFCDGAERALVVGLQACLRAVSQFSRARFGMMMGQERCCAWLFEGAIDGKTTPGLGTLQAKDLGDGGSHIELHHHVGNLISLLDALAADDKGSLHLE